MDRSIDKNAKMGLKYVKRTPWVPFSNAGGRDTKAFISTSARASVPLAHKT